MTKFTLISTDDCFVITLANVKSNKRLLIKYSDLEENINMVNVNRVYEEIRNRIESKYDVEKSAIKLEFDNKTKNKIAVIAAYNKKLFDVI